MKKKIKTYRHKTAVNAVITVKVDGEDTLVKFTHGYLSPHRINGFISTPNEKLQKAIEAHSYYKDRFFLESVNGVKIEKEKDLSDIKKLEGEIELLTDKYETLLKTYNEEAAAHERLKLELGKKKAPVVEEKEEVVVEKVNPTVITVKNLQEAKEVLKGEPWNVPAKRMPNEKSIENRASELGVTIEINE